MTIIDSGHTFDLATYRCMFCNVTMEEYRLHGKLCDNLLPAESELRGQFVFPDAPHVVEVAAQEPPLSSP